MKKFLVLLILCLGMAGIFAGCSGKNGDSNDNNETTPTPEATNDEDTDDTEGVFVPVENPVVKEDYDINDYIKLGKYKGIEVEVKKREVTDEDIDIAIQMDLYDYGAAPVEVTDRAVKLGDTVVMDFVGYHNGETFTGGSAEDYEITVGSRVFVDGFEDQLVGAELNKEFEVNVTFPKNYSNTDLAGEPVVFKVIIKNIMYFELTEEFVKDTLGFESEEAYRESLRSQLEEEYAELAAGQKESDVYYAVINGSEITLPENLLEYYASEFKTLYTNLAGSYGMDLETLVSLYGTTMEEFELGSRTYAENMATRELIVKAICAAEGLELTEEEFQQYASEYAEQFGYESTEEFLSNTDAESLKEDILFNKIIDFLVAEAIEN